MKQKGIAAVLIILVLLLIGIGGYVFYKSFYLPKQVACTLEAKICPDGSSVGRSGPKCEFAPCPASTPSWQIINNTGYKYSISYPQSLKAIATGMLPDLTNANEVVISQDPNKEGLPVMYIEAAIKSETVYKNLSLQEIVNEDFNANVANKNVLIKVIEPVTSTSFAGIPAFTFQMDSKGFSGKWQGFLGYTGVNNVLEFERSGIHYTIFYAENSELKGVLSTFKFISAESGPVIAAPLSGAKFTSPLTIKGTVPAGWMFEGVFPVYITDSNGNVIANGQAKEDAAGSWQSGNPVNFTAVISFTTSAKSGNIILKNDNPSGDPAKDKSFSLPVTF